MWKNVLQYELGQDQPQDHSKPRDLKTLLTLMMHEPKTRRDFSPRAAVKDWIQSAQDTRHILSLKSDKAKGGPETSTKPAA